uniref:SKP1-like protein n=1 Tax=Oryza rufipogon TaxID=4529 RepID=A0A0E0QBI2_ORYRU
MATGNGEAAVVEKEGEGTMVPEALEKKVVLDAAEKEEEEKDSEAEAEAEARISKLVGDMIDNVCADHGIPLPKVDIKTVRKMAEYMNKHFAITNKEELKIWDEGFINELDGDEDKYSLFKIIRASERVGFYGLLDLASDMVARKIKAGKAIDEIRKFLGVEKDFTKEEEEKIRRENAWAFEDANTQAQEKASTGPAAAKRDRPPLDQQKNPDEIAP